MFLLKNIIVALWQGARCRVTDSTLMPFYFSKQSKQLARFCDEGASALFRFTGIEFTQSGADLKETKKCLLPLALYHKAHSP